MYRRIKSPTIVQVELTEKCPNVCLHCYNYWRSKEPGGIRKYADFPFAMVPLVAEKLADAGVFHLVLTGGEPLANKKSLKAFIVECGKRGLTCGINSTLRGLLPEDVEMFKQKHVLGVLVSLLGSTSENHDAITQSTGSFSQTIKGIQTLINNNISVSISMVISAKNNTDLIKTATLAKSLGVRGFYATKASCAGNCQDFRGLKLDQKQFNEHLEDLLTVSKNLGMKSGFLECYPLCGINIAHKFKEFLGRKCFAGVTGMTIGPTGEARPCSHLDSVYGNIFTESLLEIWERMAHWAKQDYLPEICRSCSILKQCSGGCRMEAKMLNGGIYNLDPYAMPQNVPNIISQFNQSEKCAPGLELCEAYQINKRVRTRKEDFGSIIFIGNTMAGYLDERLTMFVNFLKSGTYRPQKLGDLVLSAESQYHFENGLQVITNLVLKKILIPCEF
ncbi:MAG: Radical SAM domain protein [Candidatus Yanofskybacteria bacterium GW2011_GWC2_41_9]|uniref:Radical SAM domain protein n=1 Tax=Candidatus Yanofskybacteria bacterium GW2011_GWC2_41_9 TaxID=1619029 RepID=A0A0G0XP58_9BACT|nr:MAG: Radical SAM domain protein [Candidatus Yanofskybacteria bacterium GW2011_GWC2_41_9]